MESEQQRRLNLWGLHLSRTVINRLKKIGIYARPQLSLEHQGKAKRYVVRGVESGGALEEAGYYVTFAAENGDALAWLQTLDSLTVNGAHAVVLAPVLTRIELLRIGHTYDLCITRHHPVTIEPGQRPKLQAEEVFRGEHGYLGLELWGKEQELRGFVRPQFFTRSGDDIPIPAEFENAVNAAANGVCCVGCSHAHYSQLVAPPLSASSATAMVTAEAESRVDADGERTVEHAELAAVIKPNGSAQPVILE